MRGRDAGRARPRRALEASEVAQFAVNPTRFDPYKNFKFRIKWDGRYVAGVSRVSPLIRPLGCSDSR